ncbi:YciI family protein [Lentzea chajnantorensis]
MFGSNRDERLAARPAHREYIASLAEKGVVLAAGPYSDDTGALIIYEAADETALQEIIAADPYTPANVVTKWDVRPWNALLGSWLNG